MKCKELSHGTNPAQVNDITLPTVLRSSVTDTIYQIILVS